MWGYESFERDFNELDAMKYHPFLGGKYYRLEDDSRMWLVDYRGQEIGPRFGLIHDVLEIDGGVIIYGKKDSTNGLYSADGTLLQEDFSPDKNRRNKLHQVGDQYFAFQQKTGTGFMARPLNEKSFELRNIATGEQIGESYDSMLNISGQDHCFRAGNTGDRDNVYVIDLKTGKTKTIALPGYRYSHFVSNPKRAAIYFVNKKGSDSLLVDIDTKEVLAQMPTASETVYRQDESLLVIPKGDHKQVYDASGKIIAELTADHIYAISKGLNGEDLFAVGFDENDAKVDIVNAKGKVIDTASNIVAPSHFYQTTSGFIFKETTFFKDKHGYNLFNATGYIVTDAFVKGGQLFISYNSVAANKAYGKIL
ncbi:hypothetical protein COT97_00860 [Candidatus Falkowbacteria bacterium CG10_big_fil_rev_8_21_14_0_10_39_11]|uniref:Uncharacterized protein n=1 Tax=Candidatus Falkowbacteria bacterium CG10_big_fil_rev_8_21_14_0_10_39_11 TaxID=1974565 RepID=A0A2H0V5Z3_9BACT|nr:MAG: hypothetical protein COT97_00860 [Candidatus Falkowbacteria bacterium CG10_big_fil_rev_8_21_14_0_10_39_11]